jgi:flavorubredoxin
MIETYHAAPDIEVLTEPFPIPGMGLVPINAFILKASEPVLVDTGAMVSSDEFMDALRALIDPEDLRWIWLTHTDFDHIGSLQRVLQEAPQARVITTFLGVGILSLASPLPMDRVNFVNPGEQIDVGDRTLRAFRPPAFDNPSTTGFYDEKSGALFSSDCFGALLQAAPHSADDLSEQDLRQGQMFWATVDSPWLHKTDQAVFGKELDIIRKLEPRLILSSHLPAADGKLTERLVSTLADVPNAQPFVGPDQAALEQMLKQMMSGAQG